MVPPQALSSRGIDFVAVAASGLEIDTGLVAGTADAETAVAASGLEIDMGLVAETAVAASGLESGTGLVVETDLAASGLESGTGLVVETDLAASGLGNSLAACSALAVSGSGNSLVAYPALASRCFASVVEEAPPEQGTGRVRAVVLEESQHFEIVHGVLVVAVSQCHELVALVLLAGWASVLV